MNPYDFVRVDWMQKPIRKAATAHDHFEGLNGRLEGTLTTRTPFFLPATDPRTGGPLKKGEATLFSQNPSHRNAVNPDGYFVGGSSLKGLFRSVVETVAQGCFWFCADRDNLPEDFKPCRQPQALCPPCRLFGLIKGGTLRLGNVGFEDAVCTHATPHKAIYTAILSNPKPRHKAFYLTKDKVAGRKFYFHSDRLLQESGWRTSKEGKKQNAYIQPLGADSTFHFSANFVNVKPDDFSALLYALTLEAGACHKFGYAKPCGLGSVQIELTRLTLHDPAARYRQQAGTKVYDKVAGSDTLTPEVNKYLTPFIGTIPQVTRDDLRRIWQWPPMANVTFRYPTQAEFKDHPDDPISTTDSW